MLRTIKEKYRYDNYRSALKKAEDLNCVGTHTVEGHFYPCKTAEDLFKTSYSVQYDTLVPSTFETVDMAFFRWVNDSVNAFATRNDGWKKVPVVWLTQERAFQIKDDREMRELGTESLKFPLISVERTGVKFADIADRIIPSQIFMDKDGTAMVLSRKVKQSKTKNFANADSLRLYKQNNFKFKNKKVVYEYLTVPLPIYHSMSYKIYLRAEYQQQMNEIIAPFIMYTNNINQVMISNSGHTYEAFYDSDYGITNNLSNLASNEKVYEATISMNVLGYLMGAGNNQDGPQVARHENFVEIKFPREHVMLGDINDFSDDGFRP
jgi:hypothetical protein